MVSRATKAVMMVAAFAIFFALVCPVAPTPMAFQKHGSAKVGTMPIALNAALVVAFYVAMVQTIEFPPSVPSASASDLNCVRNC
jgi:hypothetical protein